MLNFKKKFLTGLLSGALLLTGSQAFANPSEMPPPMMMNEEQVAENLNGWVKHFTDEYGVDSAQVEAALKDGVNIRDVQFAAVLSKLSGKSFSDVLAMKTDWFQVAEKLGVTRAQVEEFTRQQMSAKLAKESFTDVKTVQSLIKDGYHPQDIAMAGKIANAAGKDIKSVLSKRKINNTWGDVAKSFGLDAKKFMPPEPNRHRK
ncbi:MAG: hypothetical protein IJ685_09345 [Selenomonadaceae bacterium]|nr:hypothetical protein [Selenomonadaceae bacterium]